jgi:hypothetical protein
LHLKQFYLRIAFFTFCIYVRVIINQSYKATKLFLLMIFLIHEWCCNTWGRPDLVCMAVGFTSTYVISTYHHWSCEFKSRSGEVYSFYLICMAKLLIIHYALIIIINLLITKWDVCMKKLFGHKTTTFTNVYIFCNFPAYI